MSWDETLSSQCEFQTYETVPNEFHPNETHLPSFILIATPRHLFWLCDTSFNTDETPNETDLIGGNS